MVYHTWRPCKFLGIYYLIASRSVLVQATHYKSEQAILHHSIFKSETEIFEILAEMSQIFGEPIFTLFLFVYG